MNDSLPVHVPDDHAQITAAALGLGEGEREVAGLMVNHFDYEGRRLSTNTRVLGSLSGGEGPWGGLWTR